MKIRSAVPDNGCLVFCDGRKKTEKKQKKTSVKHIRIRLIGGCVNYILYHCHNDIAIANIARPVERRNGALLQPNSVGAEIETPMASRGGDVGRGVTLTVRLWVLGSVVRSPNWVRGCPCRKYIL